MTRLSPEDRREVYPSTGAGADAPGAELRARA